MAVRGTVLVVDDSEDMLDMIERLLLEAGYAVGRAQCGKEALVSASRNLPDLVLLDIQMPDIDGWEVCERLKAHSVTRHAPVIFMTGAHLAKEDVVRGLELGAADYITKPFHGPILVQRVNAAIRAYETQKEQRQLAEARAEALTALANASVNALEARKLSGIATMASSLAADLAEPLSHATARLESLNEALEGAHREAARAALSHLGRIDEVVGRMKQLGQAIESNASAPLQEIVRTIAAPMADELRARRIEVVLDLEETPPVRGAARIAPVIGELLSNAANAVEDSGRIEVRTHRDGEWAILAVTDNGCGMDMTGERDPFAPPLAARRDGRAIGLGLPMCAAIVSSLGGSIDLESEPEQGTKAIVKLPESSS